VLVELRLRANCGGPTIPLPRNDAYEHISQLNEVVGRGLYRPEKAYGVSAVTACAVQNSPEDMLMFDLATGPLVEINVVVGVRPEPVPEQLDRQRGRR
jgi:hypothetical protein